MKILFSRHKSRSHGVVRGGSWLIDSVIVRVAKQIGDRGCDEIGSFPYPSGARIRATPDCRDDGDLGFRLVLVLR